MAIILRANGKREDIKPENGTKLSLEQLQKAVGGYIEIVHAPNCHNILIANEEGQIYDLPINIQASKIAQREIVGDIVLCLQSEIQ